MLWLFPRSGWLVLAVGVALDCAFAAVAAPPDLYAKKATWADTMLAAKAALDRHANSSSFRPGYSYMVRKGGNPCRMSVDVSAVDTLHMIVTHTTSRGYLPAVWGEAVLIAADGKRTPVADLRPLSVASSRGALTRFADKPVRVGKHTFRHGLQVGTPSELTYRLNRKYVRFECSAAAHDAGTYSVGMRFKVLNGPHKQDPAVRLWARLTADFPVGCALLGRDGPYWLCHDARSMRMLEVRLLERVARGLGELGQFVNVGLRESPELKSGPDSRPRLEMLERLCRYTGAQKQLRCVNIELLRGVLTDGPPAPGARAELDAIAARLAAIRRGLGRGDDETLRAVRDVVAAGKRLLLRRLARILGTETIIFGVRAPGRDGHWYANFGYWCSDPKRKIYGPGGTRLVALDVGTGHTTDLLTDADGAVRDPQVHYDGDRLLFSYRRGGTEHYNLYEMNADGTGLRQVTNGPYDDIEPTYLPDGDIMFCSSRCKRWVNCFHTQVATLYRCGPDGERMHPVSCNVEHDNTPWPLPDGRILFTRWEYIDRSQMVFHHLWTVNPDGTGQMVYYGNQHPGMVMIDAKPIPSSRNVVAVFCPGHGRREHTGAIRIVTPTSGPDCQPAARVVNAAPNFRDPYPLSADLFLVASGRQLLLMDSAGRTQELYRAEQDVHEPRPLVGRPREPVVPSRAEPRRTTGRLVLQDAHRGRNMDGVKPGDIRKLLVLEGLPKPVNHSGGQGMTSYLGTFTLERVLGTVPVEADGSAYFEAPANRALFFVALDENDLSVKRMHSFANVMPGETTACVGCHESRVEAPPHTRRPTLEALARPPSKIRAFDGLPSVIDFPRHIQPILDEHCVGCHNYRKRSGGVVLVGDFPPRLGNRRFAQSYWTLLFRRQFADGANHGGNTKPRSVGSSASPLIHKIRKRHHKVSLSEREQRLVWLWIESGAAYAGSYGALLTTGGPGIPPRVRKVLGTRCAGCHSKPGMRLPTEPRGIRPHYRRDIPKGTERFATVMLFNATNPEHSLALLAPLAREAGGYGVCPGPVFRDKQDPDYRMILAALEPCRLHLAKELLYHQAGFRPNTHYIREMQRFGILPRDVSDTDTIDVFATDERYWRSFWHRPDTHGR